jgi:hypothetical protein
MLSLENREVSVGTGLKPVPTSTVKIRQFVMGGVPRYKLLAY